MKRFVDDYKPIEIELQDSYGNIKKIRSKKTTLKILKEIQILEQDSNSIETVSKMLAIIFGGKAEDYENYSLSLLYDIVNYWRAEVQNPNQATEN